MKGKAECGGIMPKALRRFGITIIVPEGGIDQWHGSP
jgi:hypothetical protein